MFLTFVIGFREGIPAAPIVDIVAAAGASVAGSACATMGVALQIVSSSQPRRQQEGPDVGAIAIVIVSHPVTRTHARDLKGNVEAARSALVQDLTKTLVLVAFLALLRDRMAMVLVVRGQPYPV